MAAYSAVPKDKSIFERKYGDTVEALRANTFSFLADKWKGLGNVEKPTHVCPRKPVIHETSSCGDKTSWHNCQPSERRRTKKYSFVIIPFLLGKYCFAYLYLITLSSDSKLKKKNSCIPTKVIQSLDFKELYILYFVERKHCTSLFLRNVIQCKWKTNSSLVHKQLSRSTLSVFYILNLCKYITPWMCIGVG